MDKKERKYLRDAKTAMAIAELSSEAWKGNPIAAYILEHDYGIPVKELLEKAQKPSK